MTDPRPLPLFQWHEARHQRLALRRKLRLRAILCTMLIGALGVSLVAKPAPRLIWNDSASAPLGLYRVIPGMLPKRGDMVIARLPAQARDLASTRHYLPTNVPAVKRVAGVAGDEICAFGRQIFINRKPVALRLEHDRAGRLLTGWHGCFRLGARGYFLLNAPAASFDGRYFGVTRSVDILGRAVLLWAR